MEGGKNRFGTLDFGRETGVGREQREGSGEDRVFLGRGYRRLHSTCDGGRKGQGGVYMWACLWLERGRLYIEVVVGEVGCPGLGQEMTIQTVES